MSDVKQRPYLPKTKQSGTKWITVQDDLSGNGDEQRVIIDNNAIMLGTNDNTSLDVLPKYDLQLTGLSASVARNGAAMTTGGSRATNRQDGTDLEWDAGLGLADGDWVSVRYVPTTPLDLSDTDRIMLEITHDNNWINSRLQLVFSSVANSSTGASSRVVLSGGKHLSEMAWMTLKSDFATFSGSGVNWADVKSIEFRFTKHTATNTNQRAKMGLKRMTVGQKTRPMVLLTYDDNATELYDGYVRNKSLGFSPDIFLTDYETPLDPTWTSTKCSLAQDKELAAAGYHFYPHNIKHKAYSFAVSSYSRSTNTVTVNFSTANNADDVLPVVNGYILIEESSAEQMNGRWQVTGITGSGAGPYAVTFTVTGASFDNSGVADGTTLTVESYDLQSDIKQLRAKIRATGLPTGDRYQAATYGAISVDNMKKMSEIGVRLMRSTSGQGTQQEPLTTAMVFQINRKYGMGGQSTRLLALPTHLLTTAAALQTLIDRLLLVGGVLSVFTHGDDISIANFDACHALLASLRDLGQIDVVNMSQLDYHINARLK